MTRLSYSFVVMFWTLVSFAVVETSFAYEPGDPEALYNFVNEEICDETAWGFKSALPVSKRRSAGSTIRTA